jgi:two-component system, sensor histidine kinase
VVVENDRLAREALCAWLEEAGARVIPGKSLVQVREALHAQSDTPDFVIADFRLGEGTGVEVIEAVRADFGAVPALVISGESDILERDLPYPVLQKPVTPEGLLEALRAASPQWNGGADSRSRKLNPARANA